MTTTPNTMNMDTATKAVFAAMFSSYDDLRKKYGHALTTAQAAKELNMHPSHVRALCQAGELPCVRVGSRWRIPAAKLAAILDGDAYVG